tara:strand:- start:3970 stop:5097 length:1128 start_codon:yes stop_codon:yes gene_type:complete
MKGNSKTILFLVNVDWYFISHRLLIAKKAIAKGYNVNVACLDTGRSDEIKAIGAIFINLPISRSSINPFRELNTLIYIHKIFKKVNPDIVHNISIKAVIYGSLISKLFTSIHLVNAISGLGYNFTKNRKGVIQKLLIQLLRFGFQRKNLTVIFQNEDDELFFKENRIISRNNKIVRIKGSGVDLSKFRKTKLPDFDIIKILLPSRMLWDKGVKELRQASEILEPKYKGKIQFILCGFADKGNRAGVPEHYLKDWHDEIYVNWIGYKKDMVEVYNDCHIVVLPSYREGMPKSLIEACAVGRAIITTNAVGCRDCVDEGINGLKVSVYSSMELAIAIEKLILNQAILIKMGHNSRKKAEKEYDVNNVVSKHLKIYDY